jgi:mannose-6-phosphate isomerase-like protein (cupin superfamily)
MNDASDDTTLSPIADRVLYEDDRIRIWEMNLQPGEDSGRHRHDHDYVVVMVAGDRVGIHEHVRPDGTEGEYREADVQIGASIFIPKGGIETAVNAGKVPYRDIEIELLG